MVYRKQKSSPRPGRRARGVEPAPHGEAYSYLVDKFWRVDEVRPDGTLLVRTRKGKRHEVAAADPNLRRARWWERLLFGRRFPPRAAGG